MSQTLLWVNINLWSNRICGVFAFLNTLWMVEMCINAFIQRKELTKWVEGNWKIDLFVCTGLSFGGLASLFLPALSPSFGREIYVISGAIYILEILFMIGYKKKLQKNIEDSWYKNSTIPSIAITAITFVSMLVFAISSIVVFDY